MVGRGDDLVVAGSAPRGPANTGSAFDLHHRGTVFILAVDLVLLVYGSLSVLTAGGLVLPAGTGFLVGLPAFLLWGGYRRRQRWAYWPAVAVMMCVLLVFLFLALLHMYSGVSGSALDLVLAGFLFWASFGTWRRVRLHLLPVYRSSFLNEVHDPEADLQPGEMLAACPTCFAVLAIRPDALSSADRCPHCDQPLVSEALAARHEEEA